MSATRLPIAPEADDPERALRQLDAGELLLAVLDLRSRSRRAARRDAPTKSRARQRRCAPPASSAASTSSFTALALAPGALNTGTPRFDISATGMLLVPAPARPIACTLGANAASRACRASARGWRRARSTALADDVARARESGRGPGSAIWLSVRIWNLVWSSAVPLLELLHVVDQRPHAFERHRVVDRRAHAAHGAMALQLVHARRLGALEKRCVERLVAAGGSARSSATGRPCGPGCGRTPSCRGSRRGAPPWRCSSSRSPARRPAPAATRTRVPRCRSRRSAAC